MLINFLLLNRSSIRGVMIENDKRFQYYEQFALVSFGGEINNTKKKFKQKCEGFSFCAFPVFKQPIIKLLSSSRNIWRK